MEGAEPRQDGDLTPRQLAGRHIVLGYLAFLLAVEAHTILSYAKVLGYGNLPAQAARFALLAGLGWWLYRGSRVAKWIMVALCAGSGGFVLFAVVTGGLPAVPATVLWIAVALSFAAVLAAVPGVNDFLERQRGARAG